MKPDSDFFWMLKQTSPIWLILDKVEGRSVLYSVRCTKNRKLNICVKYEENIIPTS